MYPQSHVARRALLHLLVPCLLACLEPAAARATELLRLDRVGIVQFNPAGEGRVSRAAGVLHIEGHILWRPGHEIDRPAGLPDWAIGRPLILREAWHAYYALGFGAVLNFELQEGAVLIPADAEYYMAIGVSPDSMLAAGRLVNISTRVRLATPEATAIAGFVIDQRPRTVLIRVVGPGLRDFGVEDAATDTYLRLHHQGDELDKNNDWQARADAEAIRDAAARVGAFPLADDSLDAALLVVLPPGIYTATGELVPDSGPGSILIEVYSVPEE